MTDSNDNLEDSMNKLANNKSLIDFDEVEDHIERRRTKYDYVLMKNAMDWAKESSCKRLQVGAVLAIGSRTIMSGYNGTVSGQDNCCEDNPNIDPQFANTLPSVVHAEMNVIAFCAKKGISTEGGTLYITHSPCRVCACLLAQAGIKRVVYGEVYRDIVGVEELKKYGIEVTQFIISKERLK